MKTSANGLEFIKKEEGCKLTAYKLKGEKCYTIGIGHYGTDVQAGQTITMAKAMELLTQDVKGCETAVNGLKPGFSFTQNMFDALVSYAFNRGTGKLKDIAGCSMPEDMAASIVQHWGSATT